jgi:hypothetical protein
VHGVGLLPRREANGERVFMPLLATDWACPREAVSPHPCFPL